MRWLAVLAVTIVGGLGAATPAAPDSPNSLPMVHAYDAITYDQRTAYIAPERGPLVRAPELAPFGEHAVDHGAHGAPARSATSENVNDTTYDQIALFAQVGSATTTTASGVEAIDGDLSPVRPSGVAANTGDDLIRASDVRFTQDSIGATFKDGRSVMDTADLREGWSDPPLGQPSSLCGSICRRVAAVHMGEPS